MCSRLARFGLALAATLLFVDHASAQLLVHPRRPGQTNVRYADFDWRYFDLLRHETLELEWHRGPRFHLSPYRAPLPGVPWAWPALQAAPAAGQIGADTATDEGDATPPTTGTPAPPPSTAKPSAPDAKPSQVSREVLQTAGGIRLFFYERERALAERAAGSIEESYRYLAEQFAYAPRKTFAYFLYSSYIEFLQTELFPVQEGVLGITSTEGLELTLPYFGDHRLFQDVSTHELAHEFTLQKLITVAREANVPDAPLFQIPIWFVEGLAEYYAKRGMDPETEVLVRDLLINPSSDGYALGDFFEERMGDGLWTYKVGQARCAFLEETYGRGTLQRIIEESPRLMRDADEDGVASFRVLVGKVVHERPSRLAARFERWIKRRAYTAYLSTTQERVDMAALSHVEGLVQTLSASPSGHLLLYRSIDPETGTTSLYLLDRHAPKQQLEVVRDGKPGVETLHPVSGRNFDLTDSTLAYVAQSAGRDSIYVQRFDHESVPEPCGEEGDAAHSVCTFDVEFDLRERRVLTLGKFGILAVEALALSPDGRGLSFIGLGENGRRDVFVVPDLYDKPVTLLALTHDVYAERELSWGPGGIVFNSDATGHGKYNLFRVDPALPTRVERLTFEARDEMSPEVLPDGRVLFVAYDDAGANLYEARDGALLRHTDVPTGLYDPSPGPDGSVWALYHKGHERTPVRLSSATLLSQPQPSVSDAQLPKPPTRLSLLVDREYDPLSLQSWSPDGFFILAGFGEGGVFGTLVASASDRLHDHGLVLSASVFGSFDLTDAELTYINQERRLIWGLGVFHDASARFDETFDHTDDVRFVSYQRFFGATGIARWPINRFLYVQGELSTGAAEYFLTDSTASILRDPTKNRAERNLLDPWEDKNGGLRFHNEGGLSLGHSSIGYHRATGPISGNALLLAHTVGVQPFDDVVYQQLRLDTEQYFPLGGATNIMLRGAFGTTWGSRKAPQFYLSSFHTLRGVPFGESGYLLGREFFYATTELQFPIVTFVEFPLIDLEGVLGADFGSAGDGLLGVWRRRVLDLVFGFNVGFAPLVLRVHFGQPIGIGAPVPNDGDLVFNLSLAWRYN